MKIYYIILVGIFAPFAVATGNTSPFLFADKINNSSLNGLTDTSETSGNAYALSDLNTTKVKENIVKSETKTSKTRNVKLSTIKATNRKKMVSSARSNSVFQLLKNKQSNSSFLLKMKAETKKTRKQQERFLRKRTSGNANRYYKHYSIKGIF